MYFNLNRRPDMVNSLSNIEKHSWVVGINLEENLIVCYGFLMYL